MTRNQRARRIVKSLGLNSVNRDAGQARIQRDGAACRQATTTTANQHLLRGPAQRLRLFSDLEANRALPCDDVRMVERGHNFRTVLHSDLLRDCFAVARIAIVGNDFGA